MKTKSLLAAFAGCAFATSSALAAGAQDGHGHTDMSAFGKAAAPGSASRTIEVTMGDNWFEPETITVKPGETVRFVVRNEGDFLHEFGFGNADTIPEHQAMMAMMLDHGMITETGIDHEMMKMPMDGMHGMGGHMHGAEAGNVMVEPGKTEEFTWTFGETEGLEIVCTLPGHYESGMAGRVEFSGN